MENNENMWCALIFLIAIIPHIVLSCVENTPDNQDILFGCELGLGILFIIAIIVFMIRLEHRNDLSILFFILQLGLTIGLSYYIKTYVHKQPEPTVVSTDLYSCVNNKTKLDSLYIFVSFVCIFYVALLTYVISSISNNFINPFLPENYKTITWFIIIIIIILSGVIFFVVPVTNLITLIKFSTNVKSYNSATIATTEPIDISVTKVGSIIDNIVLKLDDTVLVKNQINKSENGLYVVTEASLERSPIATTDKKANDFVVSVLNGVQKGHWKVVYFDKPNDVYFGQPILFEADIVYIEGCKAS